MSECEWNLLSSNIEMLGEGDLLAFEEDLGNDIDWEQDMQRRNFWMCLRSQHAITYHICKCDMYRFQFPICYLYDFSMYNYCF